MSYEDQTEGFQTLLDASGRQLTFKVNDDDVPFTALVARQDNEAQPYDLDPGECQTVTVSLFKSVFDPLPTIGSYFKDDEGGRYRIKARRPNPGRPVVKFVCEYSGGE